MIATAFLIGIVVGVILTIGVQIIIKHEVQP